MALAALKQVLGIPQYAALTLVSASVVFIFAAWLPNLGLVWEIGWSPSVSVADKVQILFSLVGSIWTNFTLSSGLALIILALLFGANLSLFVYGLSLWRQGHMSMATWAGGLMSGLLGIGCASCGTFVIIPALSMVGASGLLAALPLNGQEFTILGIGLLGMSLFWTAKRMEGPSICRSGKNR